MTDALGLMAGARRATRTRTNDAVHARVEHWETR